MRTNPVQTNPDHQLTAGGAMAYHRTFRQRARHGLVALLATTAVAVGVFTAASSTPANAAAVTTMSVSCRDGVVSTYLGVSADHEIVNGGQWLSVRYYMTGPYGKTYDAGYQSPIFAPRWGSGFEVRDFRPGWYGWSTVYINVAAWDGYRWVFDQNWTRLDHQNCWF